MTWDSALPRIDRRMKLRIQFYAVARQLAGTSCGEVEVPEDATVAKLRQAIAEQYPKLAGVLASVVFAVNTEYADDCTKLSADDQIACIPPVSGG
jgi:molybdopterin synthase sulfur carrier subunit